MELFSLAEEAVVSAVLNGGAIGGEVESAVGFEEALAEGGVGGLLLCLKSKAMRQCVVDPHSFVLLL